VTVALTQAGKGTPDARAVVRGLLGAYAVFTIALAVHRNVGAGAWAPALVVLAFLGAERWWTQRTVRRAIYGTSAADIAWTLVPLLLIPMLYAQIAPLVASIPMHDATILALEHRWFGDPSSEWAQRWNSPTLSMLLHACYIAYYGIIYVPPLYLAWQGRQSALAVTVLALACAFLPVFAFFILWPVEGPRYRVAAATDRSLDPMRLAATAILERFASRGAAFPSSHVLVSVVQTMIAWRTQPRMAAFLSVLTVGLAAGAVYGGFHYLMDVIVGASTGALIAAAVLWYTRGLSLRAANARLRDARHMEPRR